MAHTRSATMGEMKEVPSFPGYLVTECGRVWSTMSNRFLTPSPQRGGHLKFGLMRGGKLFNVAAHRAVAEAYLGPAPDGACVEHIDRDYTNNHASNLRYSTLRTCNRHRVRPDLRKHIEENSIPEPNTGCWLWELSHNKYGYGKASDIYGRDITAHRLSYQAHFGPIPSGLYVCHKCDVRCCVNPKHLWLGTALDNNRDRSAKGRTARGPRATYRRVTI